MGKRGPAKKPTTLKILQGNPGKRPLNLNEPKPKPIMPPIPKWLDTAAKKEWKRIAEELKTMGLLTYIDGAALAGYCKCFSMVQAANAEIKERGTTYTTPTGFLRDNPAIDRMRQYLTLMRQYLSEFGLSPASRAGLEIKPIDAEDDPMEQIANRRR